MVFCNANIVAVMTVNELTKLETLAKDNEDSRL